MSFLNEDDPRLGPLAKALGACGEWHITASYAGLECLGIRWNAILAEDASVSSFATENAMQFLRTLDIKHPRVVGGELRGTVYRLVTNQAWHWAITQTIRIGGSVHDTIILATGTVPTGPQGIYTASLVLAAMKANRNEP